MTLKITLVAALLGAAAISTAAIANENGVAGARDTTRGVGLSHVTAQVGDTVYGARGTTLGTVAGADDQGNLKLQTDDGVVTLPAGLLSYKGGELKAPTTSPADLMAMAETQGD
jgi:hypothetical protein